MVPMVSITSLPLSIYIRQTIPAVPAHPPHTPQVHGIISSTRFSISKRVNGRFWLNDTSLPLMVRQNILRELCALIMLSSDHCEVGALSLKLGLALTSRQGAREDLQHLSCIAMACMLGIWKERMIFDDFRFQSDAPSEKHFHCSDKICTVTPTCCSYRQQHGRQPDRVARDEDRQKRGLPTCKIQYSSRDKHVADSHRQDADRFHDF